MPISRLRKKKKSKRDKSNEKRIKKLIDFYSILDEAEQNLKSNPKTEEK